MNDDWLDVDDLLDLFGWPPRCPVPKPWAHLCEHATPDADDIMAADDPDARDWGAFDD